MGLKIALPFILHATTMGTPLPVPQRMYVLIADLRVWLQALYRSWVVEWSVISQMALWQKFLIYFEQFMIPFLRYFLILKVGLVVLTEIWG